jgi:hypothetical protein
MKQLSLSARLLQRAVQMVDKYGKDVPVMSQGKGFRNPSPSPEDAGIDLSWGTRHMASFVRMVSQTYEPFAIISEQRYYFNASAWRPQPRSDFKKIQQRGGNLIVSDRQGTAILWRRGKVACWWEKLQKGRKNWKI